MSTKTPDDEVFEVLVANAALSVRFAAEQTRRMRVVSADAPKYQLTIAPHEPEETIAASELPEAGILFADHSMGASLLRVPLQVEELQTERNLRCGVLSGALRIQRRHYFRLRDPNVPFSVKLASQTTYEPVQLCDLSAGGASVRITGQTVAGGEHLWVRLEVPPKISIEVRACVQRVVQESNGDALLSLQFVELRQAHEDRVAAYLMQEQTRRKRGEKKG